MSARTRSPRPALVLVPAAPVASPVELLALFEARRLRKPLPAPERPWFHCFCGRILLTTSDAIDCSCGRRWSCQ